MSGEKSFRPLVVGDYRVSCASSGNSYFFYLGKGGYNLWSIKVNCYEHKKQKFARLAKLVPSPRDSSIFSRALELDLFRYYFERVLYTQGYKVAFGRTNSKLVNALKKRGWDEKTGYYNIEKHLSPKSNPKPLLLLRIQNAKRRMKTAKSKGNKAKIQERKRRI